MKTSYSECDNCLEEAPPAAPTTDSVKYFRESREYEERFQEVCHLLLNFGSETLNGKTQNIPDYSQLYLL